MGLNRKIPPAAVTSHAFCQLTYIKIDSHGLFCHQCFILLPQPHKPSCSSAHLALSSQTAVETMAKTRSIVTNIWLKTNGSVLSPSSTVESHIKQKSLGGCVMVDKGAFRICCLSPSLVAAVCGRVCVCSVEIVSLLLDPTSRITRGSVLVSPGDSQSVLALQYTK